MRINNNIMALNAHRQLAVNQTNASKSMERLSSGMRINRAGDDAAGLAISEKMRGQIRGLKQAQRNAQDGISLIQTAEGALNEIHAILQRMRELATQSATDTNTEVDRGEIQKEIDQLVAEITRIAETTEFNTQTLMDGTFAAKFHIGANAGQNVDLAVNDMTSKALGLETAGKATATAGTVTYTTKNTEIKSIVVKVDTGTGDADGAAAADLEDGVLTLKITLSAGQGTALNEAALNEVLSEYGVTASGVPVIGDDGQTAEFVAVVATVGNITEAYANISDKDITGLKFDANDNADSINVSVTKNADGTKEVLVKVGKDVTLKELNSMLKQYGISVHSFDE